MSLIVVSNVNIRLIDNPTNGLIGYVSCVINDAIKLNNIRIQKSVEGDRYLVYPAKVKALPNGEKQKYYFFNPVSREANEALDAAILGTLLDDDGPEDVEEEEVRTGNK